MILSAPDVGIVLFPHEHLILFLAFPVAYWASGQALLYADV